MKMKMRRMMLLLGILFAVILLGYSISPIESFFTRKRDKKRLRDPKHKQNAATQHAATQHAATQHAASQNETKKSDTRQKPIKRNK